MTVSRSINNKANVSLACQSRRVLSNFARANIVRRVIIKEGGRRKAQAVRLRVSCGKSAHGLSAFA
jgi:hypothetical protein